MPVTFPIMEFYLARKTVKKHVTARVTLETLRWIKEVTSPAPKESSV